jgi:hypothetical protein
MTRAFFIGAAVGTFVFLQGFVIFRLPLRVEALEWWALLCGGMFGLTLGSTFANAAQATQSLTFAAGGLIVFYGVGAMILRAAYRAFNNIGVVVASIVLGSIHVALYLAVVRSVVA